MIKILIADDHPIFRMGVRNMIERNNDMAVVDEVSNGEEALDKALKGDFDIVLLDITMPEKDGLEVLKEIKDKRPGLPVLILSMYPEKQFAIRALKMGAAGYLTKESAPTELITAIREVSQGKHYTSSSMGVILASYVKQDMGKQPHETLSNREYQVMTMICSGKSLSEIAQELSLSISTASTHRQKILKKMNVKNDVEMYRYVIQNNIMS